MGHLKHESRGHPALGRRTCIAIACVAGVALSGAGHANPLDGTVVMGQAQIAQAASGQMRITQATDRAIINWQSFGIAPGESVRFIQPSTSSAMLNRVVGNDPSSILGSMSANGRVYLVNQNGVFIGRDAQIDVAGLVLSTANISNANFAAGRMNFDQPGKPGASIVNEGRITAAQGGLVAMVAPGVENRGVISARFGQVMLAGARTFSLDLYGDGLVNIAIKPGELADITDASGTPLAHYVNNSGQITAEGGRVWLSASTARNLVNGSVNISGGIRATREASRGGEITVLGGDKLDISGTLDATGTAEGGRIAASATSVALGSASVLNASGGSGGGTVSVGGSLRGEAPVPGAPATASRLDVAPGARIKADASGPVGNGGTVVLWSEDGTRFQGRASARAGAAGGDGGLIEVSGKRSLDFRGLADASAAHGKAGTLLLDPGSLTVADSGTGGFSALGADSVVAADTINGVLSSGTSVVLSAIDGITVVSQIDARSLAIRGANLTLSAGGLVAVNAPIVLNDGEFRSISGSFRQAPNSVIATQGAKTISIATNGDIDTQYLLTSGAVSLSSTGGSIRANQALGGNVAGVAQPLAALDVSAPSGTAAVTGIQTLGDASFRAASVALGRAIVGGLLSIAPGSNFQLRGDAQLGGLRAGSPGAPIGGFSVAGAAGGPLPQIDAGGQGVAIHASSIGTLGTIRSAGDIDLSAAGGSIQLGKLEATGAGRITVRSAGAIDLPESASILSSGGDVTLSAAGGGIQALGVVAANDPATVAAAPSSGNITLDAQGDIGVRQLVAFGDTRLTSAAGSVTLNQSLGGTDDQHPLIGSLFIRAGRDVTTNGLNLAGRATGNGLGIEAGTAGQGGRIRVNDRIGVSRGDLQFGPAAATTDPNYSATLFQGVYARTGNQSITFNVPVIADGSRILEGWKQILAAGQSTENLARLVDLVLIPVNDLIKNDLSREPPNPVAEALVAAGGGFRVATDNGVITRVCTGTAECGSQRDYWMVPKVVISNQEVLRKDDNGKITLAAGWGLVQRIDGLGNSSPSVALKILAPMSARERVVLVDPLTILSFSTLYRQFELQLTDIERSLNVNPVVMDNLLIQPAVKLRNTGSSSTSDLVYIDIFPSTVEAFPINRFVPNGVNPDGPTAVSLLMFSGPLGTYKSGADTGHTLPSGELGFYSNSVPRNFTSPSAGRTTGLDLSTQVLGALPGVAAGKGAAAAIGGNSPSARDVVATASAVENRASATEEDRCRSQDGRVVGRTAAGEADLGMTSALMGAPRSVFATNYTLSEVSDRLATPADRPTRGARRLSPCS